MRSHNEQEKPPVSSEYRELQMLSEVDTTPDITQRQLSSRVGIALGLTNVLVRSLVSRGYIKVSQASWKRRLYTLTPEGFSHRLNLMTNYVQSVLDHYQNVRKTLRDQLEPLALNSESRIAICGTGQFAELVYLGLKEIGIEEIAFFENGPANGRRFLGALVREMSTIRSGDYDRVVIASIGLPDDSIRQLTDQGIEAQHVVTFFVRQKKEQKSQ